MDLNDKLQFLTDTFKNKDWFHSVGTDPYGRLVVYTHFMCNETLNDIPEKVEGKQVLCHLAGSKIAVREQFTTTSVVEPLDSNENIPFDLTNEFSDLSEYAEPDLEDLTEELDYLEKISGPNILQDIFYEIHDRDNAVTNLSVKFPEVRSSLESLYKEYGFDVIYEELDG